MTNVDQRAQIARLQLRLDEAEETLRAIRGGAVDAFVVEAAGGPKVYTLETADRPYRLLVEQMQQGALTLASDGTIAYGNRRFADLVGRPLAGLVGAAFSDFIPPAARALYEALLQQGLAGSSHGETNVRRADGVLVPVFLSLNALPPDSGVAVGLLVTDLTTQRHQEEKDALLAVLKEADVRKNEFLAMLSHELRAPLAPLVSALQVLGLQHQTESPIQLQARSIMDRQMGRLRHLVDELLEVSRITTGELQVHRERMVVGDLVAGAVESARPLMEQRRHALVVSLPTEPIWLHGDLVRLEQVLGNLLSNAAEYTEQGGRVWLTVEVAPPHVVIRVRDTGVGIDAALLPRIFDLFSQAQRSLDRSQGGLGVGLALVRRVTELHGGTVEAHSQLGQGSEFVVRLPMLATAAPQPQPPTEPVRSTKRRLRVLVVDDDVDTALALETLLCSWGHEVRTAHDGTAAVQAAVDYRPEVVLLDIGLPGLNGYQVARRLRREPGLENTVLVAVTGYGQASDRKASLEAGFNHHLTKPARLEQLAEILASVPPARVTADIATNP